MTRPRLRFAALAALAALAAGLPALAILGCSLGAPRMYATRAPGPM